MQQKALKCKKTKELGYGKDQHLEGIHKIVHSGGR